MTKGNPKNVAASVRQRLQNLARERKEDFQLVLSRYALERLLHRIGQSPHRERFVVKGAMLFHLWGGLLNGEFESRGAGIGQEIGVS